MWRNGIYTYSAIKSFIPILVTIPEKNAKPLPYLEKPLLRIQEEEGQKELEDTKTKNENLKVYWYLKQWAKGVSEKFNKK